MILPKLFQKYEKNSARIAPKKKIRRQNCNKIRDYFLGFAGNTIFLLKSVFKVVNLPL